jgi:acyl dehydratase
MSTGMSGNGGGPDVRGLVGLKLGPERFTWTAGDAVLYAIAVGMSPAFDLPFVYEDLGPRVLPTFGSMAATHLFLRAMPDLRLDPARVLHGEETTVFYRTLPPSGSASVTRTCVGALDKGASGVLLWESVLWDADGPLLISKSSSFVRGAGGFGGPRGTDDSDASLPDRAPDLVVSETTWTAQAALYRLLGDVNPIHIDPDFAAAAGYARPILHGMCTYGAILAALVRSLRLGESEQVRFFRGRFAGVVLPGDDLITQMWLDAPGVVRFEAQTGRGTPALTRGRLEWQVDQEEPSHA